MAMKAMMKEMKATEMIKAGRAIMNENNDNDESWEGNWIDGAVVQAGGCSQWLQTNYLLKSSSSQLGLPLQYQLSPQITIN